MSTGTPLNDLFKSLPQASELDGKNVMVYDAQGNPESADLIALKCRILFGASTVVSKRRTNAVDKTPASLKSEVTKTSQWYSEFPPSIPAGIHVTITFALSSGASATVYAYTLDAISTTADNRQYRSILPLMLEITGYAPYWNPHAAIP